MVLVDGTVTCWLCKESTPSEDGSRCVDEHLPENCSMATNNSHGISCYICNKGYSSDNGICKLNSLKGCLNQYHPSPDQVHCDFCNIEDNYYAYSSAGKCKLVSQKEKFSRLNLFNRREEKLLKNKFDRSIDKINE